jgi:hypothetical protein
MDAIDCCCDLDVDTTFSRVLQGEKESSGRFNVNSQSKTRKDESLISCYECRLRFPDFTRVKPGQLEPIAAT